MLTLNILRRTCIVEPFFSHPFDNFAGFSDFFILHCCRGLVAYEQLLEYKKIGLVDSWLYYRSNILWSSVIVGGKKYIPTPNKIA
jgi:hypothetical protein